MTGLIQIILILFSNYKICQTLLFFSTCKDLWMRLVVSQAKQPQRRGSCCIKNVTYSSAFIPVDFPPIQGYLFISKWRTVIFLSLKDVLYVAWMYQKPTCLHGTCGLHWENFLWSCILYFETPLFDELVPQSTFKTSAEDAFRWCLF